MIPTGKDSAPTLFGLPFGSVRGIAPGGLLYFKIREPRRARCQSEDPNLGGKRPIDNRARLVSGWDVDHRQSPACSTSILRIKSGQFEIGSLSMSSLLTLFTERSPLCLILS